MRVTYSLNEMHGSQWKVRAFFSVFPAGMTDWLEETFGKMNGENYWTNHKDTIYFSSPKELTMFQLKWATS